MTTIRVKKGVHFEGFTRALTSLIDGVIDLVDHAQELSLDLPEVMVITSGSEKAGNRLTNSKHYSFEAIDIRSNSFPNVAAVQRFIRAYVFRMGDSYDIMLRYQGKPYEHIHCEFDPK